MKEVKEPLWPLSAALFVVHWHLSGVVASSFYHNVIRFGWLLVINICIGSYFLIEIPSTSSIFFYHFEIWWSVQEPQDSQLFQRAAMSLCILLIWHILYNFSNFCVFVAFRAEIGHCGLCTASLHSSDHGIATYSCIKPTASFTTLIFLQEY